MGTPFPKNPASAANVVQQRIGSLLPDGKDHWCEVTADTSPEALGNEVAEALSVYGLPFLDRLNTVGDLVALADTNYCLPYVPGNVALFRAILLWCGGEQAQALQRLEALQSQNKHPGFGEMVAIVQGRLQATRAA